MMVVGFTHSPRPPPAPRWITVQSSEESRPGTPHPTPRPLLAQRPGLAQSKNTGPGAGECSPGAARSLADDALGNASEGRGFLKSEVRGKGCRLLSKADTRHLAVTAKALGRLVECTSGTGWEAGLLQAS